MLTEGEAIVVAFVSVILVCIVVAVFAQYWGGRNTDTHDDGNYD